MIDHTTTELGTLLEHLHLDELSIQELNDQNKVLFHAISDTNDGFILTAQGGPTKTLGGGRRAAMLLLRQILKILNEWEAVANTATFDLRPAN